jgi:hypothetical protein
MSVEPLEAGFLALIASSWSSLRLKSGEGIDLSP